jgi:hypothetical protein
LRIAESRRTVDSLACEVCVEISQIDDVRRSTVFGDALGWKAEIARDTGYIEMIRLPWPFSARITTPQQRRGYLATLAPEWRLAVIAEAMPGVDLADIDSLDSMLVDGLIGASVDGRRPTKRRAAMVWDEALRLCVSRWPEASDSCRQLVLASVAKAWLDVREVLGEFATAPDWQVAVIRFCREAARPELVPVIAPLLSMPNEAIAEQAERAILALVDALPSVEWPSGTIRADREAQDAESAGPYSATRSLIEVKQQRLSLERELAGLLDDFSRHRRRGVLLAAVALLDPDAFARHRRGIESPIAQWLIGAPAEVLSAVRLILRTGREPLVRLRAWQWLAHESMAWNMTLAAIDRLAVAHGPADHEAVLKRASWVLLPTMRARLGLVAGDANSSTAEGPSRSKVVVALPKQADWGKLSVEARLGAGLLALHSGVRTGPIGVIMESAALLDPVPAVRRACLKATDPAKSRDACFDADPRVALLALERWSVACKPSGFDRAGEETRRWLGHLARSRHEPIRHAAEAELARRNPWHPSGAGRLAFAAWLRQDQGGALQAIRARIHHGETVDRLAAIALARHSGLLGEVQAELIQASGMGVGPEATRAHAEIEAKVATSAVAALGSVDSPEARRVLSIAMEADEPRMRSNAIEAMTRAVAIRHAQAPASKLYASLIEAKSDEHHRVRSTACRALLELSIRGGLDPHMPPPRQPLTARDSRSPVRAYEPAALETVQSMLADERPLHRIAALWLIESLAIGPGLSVIGPQWPALAQRLGMLAREDDEPIVKARATRCARRWLWATQGSEIHQPASAQGAPA